MSYGGYPAAPPPSQQNHAYPPQTPPSQSSFNQPNNYPPQQQQQQNNSFSVNSSPGAQYNSFSSSSQQYPPQQQQQQQYPPQQQQPPPQQQQQQQYPPQQQQPPPQQQQQQYPPQQQQQQYPPQQQQQLQQPPYQQQASSPAPPLPPRALTTGTLEIHLMTVQWDKSRGISFLRGYGNDPYVNIRLGSSKCRSKVYSGPDKATCAKYYERFTFPVTLPMGVDFEVLDQDSVAGDAFIGSVTVDISTSTNYPNDQPQWYDLCKNNKKIGRLQCSMKILPTVSYSYGSVTPNHSVTAQPYPQQVYAQPYPQQTYAPVYAQPTYIQPQVYVQPQVSTIYIPPPQPQVYAAASTVYVQPQPQNYGQTTIYLPPGGHYR